MTQGKLFQTDDYILKWVFLNPVDGLYLGGFGNRESAEDHGKRYGFDMSEPQKVSMAQITAMQPVSGRETSSNSAPPEPELAPPPKPAAVNMRPLPRRPGVRMG